MIYTIYLLTAGYDLYDLYRDLSDLSVPCAQRVPSFCLLAFGQNRFGYPSHTVGNLDFIRTVQQDIPQTKPRAASGCGVRPLWGMTPKSCTSRTDQIHQIDHDLL